MERINDYFQMTPGTQYVLQRDNHCYVRAGAVEAIRAGAAVESLSDKGIARAMVPGSIALANGPKAIAQACAVQSQAHAKAAYAIAEARSGGALATADARHSEAYAVAEGAFADACEGESTAYASAANAVARALVKDSLAVAQVFESAAQALSPNTVATATGFGARAFAMASGAHAMSQHRMAMAIATKPGARAFARAAGAVAKADAPETVAFATVDGSCAVAAHPEASAVAKAVMAEEDASPPKAEVFSYEAWLKDGGRVVDGVLPMLEPVAEASGSRPAPDLCLFSARPLSPTEEAINASLAKRFFRELITEFPNQARAPDKPEWQSLSLEAITTDYDLRTLGDALRLQGAIAHGGYVDLAATSSLPQLLHRLPSADQWMSFVTARNHRGELVHKAVSDASNQDVVPPQRALTAREHAALKGFLGLRHEWLQCIDLAARDPGVVPATVEGTSVPLLQDPVRYLRRKVEEATMRAASALSVTPDDVEEVETAVAILVTAVEPMRRVMVQAEKNYGGAAARSSFEVLMHEVHALRADHALQQIGARASEESSPSP